MCILTYSSSPYDDAGRRRRRDDSGEHVVRTSNCLAERKFFSASQFEILVRPTDATAANRQKPGRPAAARSKINCLRVVASLPEEPAEFFLFKHIYKPRIRKPSAPSGKSSLDKRCEFPWDFFVRRRRHEAEDILSLLLCCRSCVCIERGSARDSRAQPCLSVGRGGRLVAHWLFARLH